MPDTITEPITPKDFAEIDAARIAARERSAAEVAALTARRQKMEAVCTPLYDLLNTRSILLQSLAGLEPILARHESAASQIAPRMDNAIRSAVGFGGTSDTLVHVVTTFWHEHQSALVIVPHLKRWQAARRDELADVEAKACAYAAEHNLAAFLPAELKPSQPA